MSQAGVSSEISQFSVGHATENKIKRFLHSARNDSQSTLALDLYFALAPLAFCRFFPAQFRLDKHVNVTVHYLLHIAGLSACAVVFHHLIWLKHVRANLVSPRDLAFFPVLALHLSAFLVFFELVKLCFQHFHRQLTIAPLAALGLAGDHNSV